MLKILFGTGNISKFNRIKAIIKDLPIELLGINDLNIKVDITEDGNNVEENALKKAKIYYRESNIPTFSIDSGLYIDKLPEDKQPGIYVRRINGKRATDREMLKYYKKQLEKVGGRSRGKWVSSLVFVLDEDRVKTFKLVEERIFTSRLSPVINEGLPLSSMAIDPTFNKYVSEITEKEREKLNEETGKKLYNIFVKILKEVN